MKQNIPNRQTRFRYDYGALARDVAGDDGRTYTHRCTLVVYEAVAHAIAETPLDGHGVTGPEIARMENVAFSQVNVALTFLQERGIVDQHHRRNYPASDSTHLDAMVEWHALREEPNPA